MNSDRSFHGRRVFIVEDEMIIAWLLEQSLSELGYEVVGHATRVKEALTMVEVKEFDVVSLDINLNGEKSYPVADALTARGIPFFFSTAYNKDSIPTGYRDYPMLQKPYDHTKLESMLSTLLTPKAPERLKMSG
jgi:CheY-like chemotaxis protein